MARKISFSFRFSFSYVIIVLSLLLSHTTATAQCAGQNNSVTICDIPNPTSQTINLFTLLGGTPTAGGTWTDNDLSGGLNPATGILNAQAVSQSGVYHYTYTVTGVPGCVNNTATITVTIGGFSGVTGPNASVCSDSGNFNLFQVFNGSALSPQSNGTWFNNTTNTAVAGNSVVISSLGIGTFQFTYTIPAIGTCPARSSTAFVTIYRAPRAGTPNDLLLCDSDNLSAYTNLDLNTLLTGEDGGGRWVENSGTAEITSLLDHNVNVQNIYNTFGPGIYTFTYTVQPQNPICDPKSSTVRIIIEKRLDFTGATLAVNFDICEPQIPTATYTAVINQGAQAIANGQYNVTYQVSGPNGSTNTIIAAFINGVMTFPLSATFFQQVGTFTVNITNITAVSSLGACTNIINNLSDTLVVSPRPVINTATLVINPVCKNLSSLVQITGASGLANGTYTITYNLSGANIANGQTATITVSGGVSNFTVPSALIPNVGTTTIIITNVTNTVTTCTNTASLVGSIVVNPLPDPINFSLNVSDVCLGQPVVMQLGGLGTLTNITISYVISGANTTTSQTIPLVVTAGNASFTIPAAQVPNTGASSISVTNLTNTGNSCGVIVNNLTDAFTINTIPVAPVANNQSFCAADNTTVANLIPSGSTYQWFNSPTSTTPLPSSTPLVSGNYYIKQINATSCASTATMITVTINSLTTPTLNPNGEQFCGLDNPTLQQLSANANSTGTILWYNAPSGGTQLPNNTLLQEGVTYYGFNSSTANSCLSTNGLAVTVSLTNCNNPPVAYDFFIPDGFSPNDDGVNDTYTIPKIEFLFPDYTLEIYNRYGNVMFKGDKNKPYWDGKAESGGTGGLAPNGVYFYVVNFNKGDKSPLQGRLYLNR